jgi:hypothetical protein
MNGHFLVVLISPAGSAAAERTEGEPPGDPKRSARLERNSMAEENPKLRRQNAGLTEDLPKAQPSTPDLSGNRKNSGQYQLRRLPR